MNDISLSSKEKTMILKWIDQGVPKKSKKDELLWKKPEKEKTATDYIVRLPQPVNIPEEGLLNYIRFVIQTNFKKDKWIRNIDFQMKPKVIHHTALYMMDSKFDFKGSILPSNNLNHFFSKHILTRISQEVLSNNERKSNEIGVKLPAQSKLVFELHYEPIGQKIIDDYTHIKINFHKKKPKYTYANLILNTKKINIPPHKSNHKITISHKVNKTIHVYSMKSHMHLRGKSSDIFVIDPQGKRKRIFGIDPFSVRFEKKISIKKSSHDHQRVYH